MILMDKAGHLASDVSLEELHRFARRLGLKRQWFQDGKHPHYDLTTVQIRGKASSMGAETVTSRELILRGIGGDETENG